MQFSITFATLLAGVLIGFSAQDAEATPVTKRTPAGLVTLPLKRVHESRSDVHPLIRLQQKRNRAERRIARMTGRDLPSDLVLRERLVRRIADLEEEEGIVARYNRVKVPRYNRVGRPRNFVERHNGGGNGNNVPDDIAAAAAAALQGNDPFAATTTGKHKKKGGKGKGNGNGNAGTGAAGNGTAATDTATDAATDTATATDTAIATDTATATDTAIATDTATANDTATATDTATGAAQTVPIPQDVTVSNDPTADNSLALDIEGQDTGYVATVQVGTPPQDFLILMDSGSSDFWIGSADQCVTVDSLQNAQVTQNNCGQHNFLGTQTSSSFQASTSQFSVTYGTGQVAGLIVQDDVTIAGLTLKAHTFGVAEEETTDFSGADTTFDGLMGLAQSILSNQGVLTPVEDLAKQGLITEAITSYKIPRLADKKLDGEITFGGLDTAKFDQATLVTLDNVNQQGFWEADMDSVTVDGTDVGLTGRTAILDTGTTLIIAPGNDAATVLQQVPGAGGDAQQGFTVPCDTTSTVSLSFGGTTFDIDPRDLAAGQVQGNTCLAGIQSGNIGGAQEWLVGDVFLKNAYFSHDVGKNTVSLAKLV